MFGSLAATVSDNLDGIRTKAILYIIVGIIALVIINLLLDSIRKFIRGLDTAALGAVLIWLGFEAKKLTIVKAVSDLLLLIGWTLVIVGLLVFILIKLFRGKRNRRKRAAAQKDSAPAEKQPPAEEGKN